MIHNPDATTRPEDFHEVEVPSTFFFDHEDRALISELSGEYTFVPGVGAVRPYVLKQRKRTVVVRLHTDDVIDLLSDAVHYAGGHAYTEPEYLGLVSSARNTVLRLHRAGFGPELLLNGPDRDMRMILEQCEARARKAAATKRARARR